MISIVRSNSIRALRSRMSVWPTATSCKNEYSGLPQDEMLAKAQAATDKALALDDRLAEAYTSLGKIEHYRNDYEAAEAAYQRALELNPNYVDAYHWYADLLVDCRWGDVTRRSN